MCYHYTTVACVGTDMLKKEVLYKFPLSEGSLKKVFYPALLLYLRLVVQMTKVLFGTGVFQYGPVYTLKFLLSLCIESDSSYFMDKRISIDEMWFQKLKSNKEVEV